MDISTYINKALDIFNARFTSKSSQKMAMEYLGRAYDKVRNEIGSKVLDIRNEKFGYDVLHPSQNPDPACMELNELYYLLPFDLHNYRTVKHGDRLKSLFPELVDQIEVLFELRNQFKSTEIQKAVPKVNNENIIRIEKSLAEIFEARIESYDRALRIAELFKGVPVSVSPHMVYMNNGTKYVRYFYYVAGRMTALNTILCAMDTYAREQENKLTNK